MDCNGNIYNIGMGCCEPVLGPIENYYTKPTIDRMLDEITSAITSGCCITPEQVDEKIDEAISGISAVTIDEVQEMIDEAVSGITVSGVTEEQMNEAIASAKTEIEAEIPIVPTKVSAFENDVPYLTEHQSLSGYATEQWVEDKHYITGVDLSDYALKSEIPTVPTSNTAFTNDAGYLTEHQSLSGYATEAFVSGFTYDKATIDEKVAGGGSFDPSQYYNKTATDELLAEKLDVTAYTPVDLSNYYTTGETVNLVESAVTRVEGEIPTVPTVPTDISAFNNDVGYITGVDLSNYATVDNLTAATDDMATQTWVSNQGYLTEHQSLSAYSTTEQVNSAITEAVSGKQDTLISGTNIKTINNESLLGSGNITIQGGGGTDAPISAGTGTNSIKESSTDNIASGDYSHAEGNKTKATGKTAHAEGSSSTAGGWYSHAEGASTKATGTSAHAEGFFTNAYGSYSHAEGSNTETKNFAEHASGQYNVSSSASTTFGDSGNTLFSVGNGGAGARHNAFEIRQNGDVYVTSGGTDVLLQDSIVTSTEKATWNAKPDVWCGTLSQWSQISGNTQPNTIYLVY